MGIESAMCRVAFASAHGKPRVEPHPLFPLDASIDSREVSSEAVQLAKIIEVLEPLKRIQEMRRKRASGSLTADEHQDFNELRLEVMEKVEQSRLDMDFVTAEIDEEMAGGHEIYETYSNHRDEIINRANAYAFRTNGVLWAVAEALSIPTYARPRYAISAGTIGITAGLVPTAFSLYALHSLPGRHYQRAPYPNMLSKLFGEPLNLRTEFPSSVWKYLSTVPDGKTQTRKDMLIEYWMEDKNISCLTNSQNRDQVDLITGAKQNAVTIQVMNDRLTMLGHLKAVVNHMAKPLCELQMVERGQKDIRESD